MHLPSGIHVTPKTGVSYVFFCLLMVSGNLFADQPEAPSPDMPEDNFSDSGYIKVKWTEKESYSDAIYQLEQSDSPDFSNAQLMYEGPDRASFISGLPDGVYYFRVRRIDDEDVSEWSHPITLEVKHHSLQMAFGLASVGILVFLLTAGIVIKGVRNDNQS